ncbi:MAG: DUF4091 domain-containing protein [Abditibacteriota bacterium]|nr:DUF4091 domain-containing protein [Abditibacteriota bacterium]
MTLFLTNSNKRVYPSAKKGSYKKPYIAQGETFAYQVSIYNDSENLLHISLNIEGKFKHIIRACECVLSVGHTTWVPLEEIDGVNEYLVPEILRPTNKMDVSPFSTVSFWVTVSEIDEAGDTFDTINVKWTVDDKPEEYEEAGKAEYYISDFKINKPKSLPALHWFYADAISDYYKLKLWSDEFWAMCKKWMENYSSHGMTHIYLPLFTPPLDGIKKPTQLVKVKILNKDAEPVNRKFAFDFTDAKKWVKMAKECGIEGFECVHLFTQWGVKNPIRIYLDTEFNLTPTNVKLYDRDIELNSPEDKANLAVDVEGEATGPEYRNFLSQFFPAFKAFCEEMGIYNDVWFHVSDEPSLEHLENYGKAYKLLSELKPDIKIMDALSDREIVDEVLKIMPEGAIFMPIPSIEPETFNDITHGAYFCCGPRGRFINRFFDTPLQKTRMLGAIMYKKNVDFFLHWGYNYYYISQKRELVDPYKTNDGGVYPNFGSGDPFVVYPGEEGPIDSIRWENFYDSLQDFYLLDNLGIDRESDILKDLITYKDFPRDGDWIWNLREKLLKG